MSAVNKYSFTSFSIWMHFISFSCLIALAKTSGTCWKEVSKAEILILFPLLGGSIKKCQKQTFLSCSYSWGESIQSSIIKYDASYEVFIGAIYQVQEIPFCSLCVEVFFFFFFLILSWRGVGVEIWGKYEIQTRTAKILSPVMSGR